LPANPFAWISDRAQPRVLLALTVLTLGLSLWLSALGLALNSPAAPRGIVSFEFAADFDGAAAILASWSAEAREAAMLIQGIDCLYLLAYPAWFSLAAARLAASLGGAIGTVGVGVAWAVLVAAPLDAIENHALVQQLVDGPSQQLAQLAFWCAAPKFALVGAGASYLLVAGAAWLVRSLGSRARE
jgi:hypothetical protein